MKAYIKKQENIMWENWKLQYPLMNKETYISFEDYKKKSITRKTTQITYEEIEKEINAIIKNHEGRR